MRRDDAKPTLVFVLGPAESLALFFLYMMAAGLVPLSLVSATLLAQKVAPPWALATTASLAFGAIALIDWQLVRRIFRVAALARLREKKLFSYVERWAAQAPFITTLLFAALPLPFTFARVIVPLSGYGRARYALAVALGRWPRIFVIAMFGARFEIPLPYLVAFFSVGVAAALIATLVKWLRDRKGDHAAVK